MTPEFMIILFGAFLVLGVLLMVLNYQREKKRRMKLAAFARSRAWAYHPETFRGFDNRFPDFRFLGKGSNRYGTFVGTYNANVRDLNNRIEMFPSSIVASSAGITPWDFFEIADLSIREVPSYSAAGRSR